ncbi:cysteine desulfurase family protein [Microlunatus capsulatus]|uniref:Cysteine desulfurase n=1 Tax=Microlunatus capsulatus TaxID=99117 RepID=A0ABS4ZB92_9ACTN|nr:aminotransferase class V-fold PLP-dependent enzyme [Microlunatus capsulatus]MBP2418307.1 cysteine desulfurase [Microlunatus capsulatus]
MAETVTTVFWDASSAEPVLPEAQQAWLAAQAGGWGDPSRLHRPGRLAAQALDAARQLVADALGARPDEVVFPSSGVHAAHAAVAGLALGRRRVGEVVVTSTIDHSSVLSAADAAGRRVAVPVDRSGHLDLERWRAAVRAPGVALACLQVANHEVGTLQPVDAAAEACQEAGVPLVLDVTSALGRLDLRHLPAGTVLTAGAQAFGGPPSVGVLVLRRGVRWRAPYPTDDHQGGRWPGPPDVAGVHAAAAALEVWLRSGRAVGDRQRGLVDRLRAGILAGVPDVEVAGDPVDRVPHLLTFSALYVDGETLTLELDRAGFAVASGSACSASSEHPSHVLAAMGLLTHGNVRIGLTRRSTAGEVEAFLAVLPQVVAGIRARLGAPGSHP